MQNFQIYNSEFNVPLSDKWVDSKKFNSKYRIVEANEKKVEHYEGRQFVVISKKELHYSTFERIGRGFLGTIITISTIFSAFTLLLIPRVREFVSDLFTKEIKEIKHIGVPLEIKDKGEKTINLTSEQKVIVFQMLELLKDNKLKHPHLTIPRLNDDYSCAATWLMKNKLIEGIESTSTVQEPIALIEGWYEPEEPTISNKLLERTPNDIKRFKTNISDALKFIRNNNYYEEYKRNFRTEDQFITFVQNIAASLIVLDLPPPELQNILDDRKNVPLDLVTNCKKMFKNGKEDSLLIIWLLRLEPHFTKEEEQVFTNITNLRDILFNQQGEKYKHLYS